MNNGWCFSFPMTSDPCKQRVNTPVYDPHKSGHVVYFKISDKIFVKSYFVGESRKSWLQYQDNELRLFRSRFSGINFNVFVLDFCLHSLSTYYLHSKCFNVNILNIFIKVSKAETIVKKFQIQYFK